MDAGRQQIGERVVHQPLARDAVHAREAVAFHDDAPVRFAGAVVAHMAGMVVAVVDHLQHAEGRARRSGGRGFRRRGAWKSWSCRLYRPLLPEPAFLSRPDPKDRPNARFHGRVEADGRAVRRRGCDEPGEFRAPLREGAGRTATGRAPYRWLCLDHVRAFNARTISSTG